MKKMFAVVVLASVSAAAVLAGCGSRKGATAPSATEQKSDATGGAAYGGAAYGSARPPTGTANPASTGSGGR